MTEPLRALILEDRPADAELMVAELRRQGFATEWTRVETPADFGAAVSDDLDVILTDFNLPGFDALDALRQVRSRGLDVPVIVVTGAVGEETAAECIREGAADYLLKDRLGRLGLAVREAMRRRRLEEDRRRMEDELFITQAELRTVFESAPVPMVVVDRDLRVVRMNREGAAVAGRSPADAFARPLGKALGCAAVSSGDDRCEDAARCESCALHAAVTATLREGVAHQGVECDLELDSRGPGASTWLVSTSPLQLGDGRLAVIALADITERKAAEKREKRLNRLLATISEVNQLIVRERNRDWILAEACRIAVEQGGFRMAWIGLVQPDGAHIDPVAVAGHEDGYLDGLDVRCDDTPEGRGPAGLAVRDWRTVSVDDTATDDRFAPWRDAALTRGYRSLAAVPLGIDGRGSGVLVVYADATAAFDAEMIGLLEEMSADLAFAVAAIEAARKRERAEAALHESEERYRQLFEAESDAILLIDNASGRIVEANSAAVALYGYSHDELVALKNVDLSAEAEETRRITTESAVDRDAVVRVPDRLHRRKDGTVFPVEITGRFFEWRGRPVHVAAIRDVTERRDAELKLRRELTVRTALAEISRIVVADAIRVPEVAKVVLDQARELTASAHGFVSEIDPATGDNVGHTLTEMMEGKCGVGEEDRKVRFPCEPDGGYPGLWGHVLNTRQPAIITDPERHPASAGTPAGHLRIEQLLAVPVLSGGELLGLIALANPERDYSDDDIASVSRLADYYAMAIARSRAQQALAQSEERYRSLFEDSPVGVFRTTPDGRVLEANPALIRMLGYDSIEELARLDLNAQGYATPTDRRDFLREIAQKGVVAGRLTALRSRDGRVIRVRETARAVRGESGDIDYIEGVFEDVTAEVDAQQERDLLYGIAADLFCVAGFDGYFKQINPAWEATLGWGEDELMSVPFLDLVHPDDRGATAAAIGALADGRPVLGFENRYRCKDGSYRWLSWNAQPLPEEELMFTVARDVTEQHQLEEQLLQAQKMEAVGRLAGGVAHDFNNLLQAMLSQLQLVRSYASDPERLGRVAEDLEEHVLRGAALTRQLLLFSRRETPQRRTVDVNNVIDGQAKLLRRLVRENIAFRIDLAAEPLVVDVDPGQLEQVIMNLVVNASDVLEDGGEVAIHSGRGRDGAVRISIEDDGPGIAEAVRPKIFEPFFTTKPAGKGTGLGLSVVHGIVQYHGGSIAVEDREGGGTVFTVTLPAVSSTSVDDETQSAEEGRHVDLGAGERVLVVEDESLARQALTELLDALGYDAIAVGSAEEAVEAAAGRGFDVLLTDLMLPGASGVDLAKRLRLQWPELAVILMSGYNEDEVTRREVGSGQLRFLQKPFDMKTLAAELRSALGPSAGVPH